jgi:mRNA interferase HigB
MRVHVIKKITVERYVKKQPSSARSFQYWLDSLKYADWNQPNDIKDTFNSADILGKGSDRAVFDIGGNSYRIICHYHFGHTEVHLYICWIGTHAEYDKINKKGDQYTINLY